MLLLESMIRISKWSLQRFSQKFFANLIKNKMCIQIERSPFYVPWIIVDWKFERKRLILYAFNFLTPVHAPQKFEKITLKAFVND